MAQRFLLLATAVFTTLLCVGDFGPTPATAATTKVYKISHNQQPSHPVHRALLQFEQNVEKRTNGSVSVDLYPSGTLADDATGLDQVALGTIQGAVIMFSPGTLLADKSDGLRYIEELPYMFPDAAAARKAYEEHWGMHSPHWPRHVASRYCAIGKMASAT